VADELHDDMLNFKDSDRESVLSYFKKFGHGSNSNNGHRVLTHLDTPTRLLNKSNDLLPI